ncbi:asparagine synthase-related protein [Salmonella enterica subsp. enterica serovar Infantis]
MSAWGVEARVPFLDKKFLDVAMRINPQDKMCGNGKMENTCCASASSLICQQASRGVRKSSSLTA